MTVPQEDEPTLSYKLGVGCGWVAFVVLIIAMAVSIVAGLWALATFIRSGYWW